MKRSVKNTVVTVLVSSMFLSFMACSNRVDDEIIDVAEDFAEAIVERDVDEIFDVTNIPEHKRDTSLFIYGDEVAGKEVKEAVISNMSYEVLPDSIEAHPEDHEATINVAFTMPDYDKLFDDYKAQSTKELIEEINEADTKRILVSVSMEYIDFDWTIVNAQKIIDRLFTDLYVIDVPAFFNTTEVDYVWHKAQRQEGHEAWYKDTQIINVNLLTDSVMSAQIYYTVTYNDEVIFKSITSSPQGIYSINQDAKMDESYHLPAGDYYITFYIGQSHLDPFIAHVESDNKGVHYEWYGYLSDVEYNKAVAQDVTFVNVELFDFYDTSTIYYTVKYNGQLVYTSGPNENDAYIGYSEQYLGYEVGNMLDKNGYLMEGEYEFTFYYKDTPITPSCYCTIKNSGN